MGERTRRRTVLRATATGLAGGLAGCGGSNTTTPVDYSPPPLQRAWFQATDDGALRAVFQFAGSVPDPPGPAALLRETEIDFDHDAVGNWELGRVFRIQDAEIVDSLSPPVSDDRLLGGRIEDAIAVTRTDLGRPRSRSPSLTYRHEIDSGEAHFSIQFLDGATYLFPLRENYPALGNQFSTLLPGGPHRAATNEAGQAELPGVDHVRDPLVAMCRHAARRRTASLWALTRSLDPKVQAEKVKQLSEEVITDVVSTVAAPLVPSAKSAAGDLMSLHPAPAIETMGKALSNGAAIYATAKALDETVRTLGRLNAQMAKTVEVATNTYSDPLYGYGDGEDAATANDFRTSADKGGIYPTLVAGEFDARRATRSLATDRSSFRSRLGRYVDLLSGQKAAFDYVVEHASDEGSAGDDDIRVAIDEQFRAASRSVAAEIELVSAYRSKFDSGVVTGRVVDADGEPVAGATVTVPVVGTEREVRARTTGDGRFALNLALVETPPTVTLLASKEGYVTASAQVDAGGETGIELTLRRGSDAVVRLTDELHHLGDGKYSGSRNSKFQEAVEGPKLEVQFQLSTAQADPDAAELRYAIRGTETDNELYVNDAQVGTTPNSPEDGTARTAATAVDTGRLQTGTNTFRAVSVQPFGHDDIDDFELWNLRLRLKGLEGGE